MRIIQTITEQPFFENAEKGYVLNINQREVTIAEHDGEEEKKKTVYEMYQQTFKRFPTIREKLEAVKSAVAMYANSDKVKQFTLGDTVGWLDSEQRTSIRDAVDATVKAGEGEYTLWLNTHPYTMPCSKVLDILATIELYSSKCYNVTSTINAKIEACGADIEQACGIDFTGRYPEKVVVE